MRQEQRQLSTIMRLAYTELEGRLRRLETSR
jgi:hypothetical protein